MSVILGAEVWGFVRSWEMPNSCSTKKCRVEVWWINQLRCDFLGLSVCVYGWRGRDWADLCDFATQTGHKTPMSFNKFYYVKMGSLKGHSWTEKNQCNVITYESPQSWLWTGPRVYRHSAMFAGKPRRSSKNGRCPIIWSCFTYT